MNTPIFYIPGHVEAVIALSILAVALIVINVILLIKFKSKGKQAEIKKPTETVEAEPADIETIAREEVSLKECLAVAAATGTKGTVTKKSIADYLEGTYGKDVEVNRRANATKPGKGKTEGLPLADTHFTLANGERKCFAYVYETDGAVLLLIKAPSEYADGLSKDHKYIKLSAFPKSKDTWYSVPIDDSWTETAVYKMLDDLLKLYGVNKVEAKEELALSESLKIASANVNNGITKKMVADYLANTYNSAVEVNRRANATKPGKGKTEGLPLADTHYTLANGNRKCFAYVYETNGAVLLLIKAPSEYADGLSKDHKYINLSAFPKSKDTWYSVPMDDSWNEVKLYKMLDGLIELNGERTSIIDKEVAVIVEQNVIKEVVATQVNNLMSDTEAKEKTIVGQRIADKTRKTMINIDTISAYFNDGETVTLEELKKRVPSFDKKATYYKVCARGTLDKKLTVDADDVSVEAKKMILLTGGKVILSTNK